MTSSSGTRDRRGVRWMRVLFVSLLAWASLAGTPSLAQVGLQESIGAYGPLYQGDSFCVTGSILMGHPAICDGPCEMVSLGGSVWVTEQCIDGYWTYTVTQPAVGIIMDVFYWDGTAWQFCSGSQGWGFSQGFADTAVATLDGYVASCPHGTWVAAQLYGFAIQGVFPSSWYGGGIRTEALFYY